MDPQGKILKFPVPGTPDPSPASEQENSSKAQVQMPPATAPVLPQSVEPPPPIWMQRLSLVTIVVFCIWVGLVLAVLPWQPVWTENSLVMGTPILKQVLGTGFMRGMVSGLGLLDIWIGISEAVHYRDRR